MGNFYLGRTGGSGLVLFPSARNMRGQFFMEAHQNPQIILNLTNGKQERADTKELGLLVNSAIIEASVKDFRSFVRKVGRDNLQTALTERFPGGTPIRVATDLRKDVMHAYEKISRDYGFLDATWDTIKAITYLDSHLTTRGIELLREELVPI